jgi:membrane protein YqaA with SNARE-associated domain
MLGEGKVLIRSHVTEASGSSEAGMYLFASSFVAALLDSLFEHPVVIPALVPNGNRWPYIWLQQGFRSLLKLHSGYAITRIFGESNRIDKDGEAWHVSDDCSSN